MFGGGGLPSAATNHSQTVNCFQSNNGKKNCLKKSQTHPFIPFILVSSVLFFISDPGSAQAIFLQALIPTTWLPGNSRFSSALNEEGEKEGVAEMLYTLV